MYRFLSDRLRFVRVLFTAAWACVWVYSSAAQPADLLRYEAPVYPTLARQANIAGTVFLRYRVSPTGEAVETSVISGHSLFSDAALRSLQTWRFKLPLDSNAGDEARTVSMVFEIKGEAPVDPYEPDWQRVWFDESGTLHLRVPVRGIYQLSGCPQSKILPPPGPIQANDYVELQRSACYGTCPGYTVRIDGSGLVTWQGLSFVKETGNRQIRIPVSDAEKVLEGFRSEQVWSLCNDYSRPVTDNPGADVTIVIGNRQKTISDYAESAPEWFQELRRSIDEAANTHQYRHGDPKNEALIMIQSEYLPKPGLTELMRASYSSQVPKVKEILESGVPVDEQDASGWTALMYAALNPSNEDVVKLLLASGANPKHVTASGDTVLMVPALQGSFDEELAAISGDINTQNNDGMTVLMWLANRADPEEIELALKAGADPRVTDRNGYRAIDYLEARRCDRSLVRGWETQQAWEVSGPCNNEPDEDYENARRLLRRWRIGNKR